MAIVVLATRVAAECETVWFPVAWLALPGCAIPRKDFTSDHGVYWYTAGTAIT